ncbi:TRAP transporter fused permease subunit [Candidatus Anaplasma sp. TIGMIC]|uniref:TRAP transporter fused permease subunit n=1 Tax=Candidatus Anaplasma sp. TIGMIC TaxID=3020713 RepID=UPI00232FACF4|nr:TRAP transporter fused permease subunit [Candidatus Anaplasma sp. TIGMIC]MDB1135132.1 TRAP transporter fused permease subunit [Candidatus Anaplasma sp. TIGMIC]
MKLRQIIDNPGHGAGLAAERYTVGCVEFLWAFFQLFIASPLPFWLASQYGLDGVVLTGLKARAVHLSFALFLLFLVIPPIKREVKEGSAGLIGWVCAILAAGSVLYVIAFYDGLAARVAMPNSLDIAAAVCGMVLLLEAARRAIGFPIVVVASLFLLYAAFGHIIPDVIAHRGHDIASIVSHEWLSSEGVFGVALGVSCNFVFLYVLFGTLLDKAGAGGFFMKLSFALLRGSVGGPAKAAVIGSGFMGMMSGSSVANTITVGSFTIPLMKKMGMSPEKAAAIEVSAGINGQITPPVMGAAAFLMAEFLALPYSDIVKHALIPALMVYIGLLVIVHFEAQRLHNVEKTSCSKGRAIPMMLLRIGLCVTSLVMLFGFIHVVIDGLTIGAFHIPGVKDIFHGASIYAIAVILAAVYIAVLVYRPESGARLHDGVDVESISDPKESGWEIFKQGLHYFIPVIILVWSLVVERVSSSLACFWTNMFLMYMLLIEGVVTSVRSRDFSGILPALKAGLCKICSAMLTSSKNMLPIAVATATAGIVVGIVGLTGFGLAMGSFVDVLAGNSVFIALLITAAICIVLGMGMPTTGCYIIVSTLVVPVLSAIVHKNGMLTSPIALHLFVFYFGLMADVTPPVGIASYAAAAIARANSFKTGMQSFWYNIKTMAIPFIFVFNNNVILYGVENIWKAAIDIVLALFGIIVLSMGMQGYFLRRNKYYESIILVAIAFMLMAPNYISSLVSNNSADIPFDEEVVMLNRGDTVRVNFDRSVGSVVNSGFVTVPIRERFEGSVEKMLKDAIGVLLDPTPKGWIVFDTIKGGYVHDDMDAGDEVTGLVVTRKNVNGYYVSIVAFFMLMILALLQSRSKDGVVR